MFPFPVLSIDRMSSVPSTFFHTQEQYDLRFEAARRSTFLYWPRSFSIPPATLAAEGFFYTGISDTVKCFACAVEISDWSNGRTPMQLHEIYCPSCRFVCNEDCGNVPIEGRSRLRPNCITKLKNLKYANYECRLDSFATFPNTHMSREQLADAGFYYDGRNDMAICHHCSIGIENWNPGEDPWVRHAISSPACCYIIEARGCEYINNVTGQDLYSNSIQEATETTVDNNEESDSRNETNEMTLVEEIAALEKENQELQDARSCIVCTEREATNAFLPCGHLATCNFCSPNFDRCIVCRKEVNAVVRVVFA